MSGVVVIGGGPGGAAAAIALARQGARPVVLDAGPGAAEKIGECLPPLANPLLALLGVSDGLEPAGHLRSSGVCSAWGSAALAERDFLFGRAGPGWHLDRAVFEAQLTDVARGDGAEWHSGVRLTGLRRDGSRWAVSGEAAGGRLKLSADYIVDASGRQSAVARLLGTRRVYHDRLVGIAAVMASPERDPPAGLYSLVEAVPSGWWYSAPLPGGRLSVVYFTDADVAASQGARTLPGWRGLLLGAHHTTRRVVAGHFGPPSRLQIMTAATSRLVACTGEGWVAVGDAAATFDPLSSHGICSALAGGYQAGLAVAEALRGSTEQLNRYPVAAHDAFEKYRTLHARHYAAEQRWPAEPFWHRRHHLPDPE